MTEYKAYKKEDLDYLFSKIDWGNSFLDARAIQIMNQPIILKSVETCPDCQQKDEKIKKYEDAILTMKNEIQLHRNGFK